jgi:hypothetical protein
VFLVEIHRILHIGRNRVIVLVQLIDAIDLDSQCDEDIKAFQVSGKSYYSRGAPTMSIENDFGLLFFDGTQLAVVIRIQSLNEIVESFVCLVISEHSDVGSRAIVMTQISRE